MRVERKHAIAHAAGSGELPVFEREEVNQNIGVDVIEVVAVGNVGTLLAKQSRDVGVFAVEISDIGVEASLL